MKNLKFILIALILSLTLIACQRKITDEDINNIVTEKNISDITWEDFDGYTYQEDKSHGLVRIYTLEDGTTLILSGPLDSDKPSVISIVEINGNITYLKNEKASKTQ